MLDDLIKIQGIGEETLKDIKRVFSTEEELREALREGRVPLRNDKVELLRRYYTQGAGRMVKAKVKERIFFKGSFFPPGSTITDSLGAIRKLGSSVEIIKAKMQETPKDKMMRGVKNK